MGAEEDRPTTGIIELATMCGRYGYCHVTAMLRQQSWMVKHKSVGMISSREELKMAHGTAKTRKDCGSTTVDASA